MTTTPVDDGQAAIMPSGGSIPADTFAARLTLARLHSGHRLSIREAAELCGLNYGTWTGWERGLEPRGLLEVVDKISQGLGIDRDWLLFGGPLDRAEQNREQWTRPDSTVRTTAYVRSLRPAPAGTHPRGRQDLTRPRELAAAA